MKKLLSLFAFPALVLACMSGIYLLPEPGEFLPSAISPTLPVGDELEGWQGTACQESEIERNTLAADTRFSKAAYTRESLPVTIGGGSLLSVGGPPLPCLVSIVFSGNDMNNSIHRPERCLPAQGHSDLQSAPCIVELPDGHRMPMTRLTTRTPLPKGQKGSLHHIHYYVFIGASQVTASHLQRTLFDMRDRILQGRVQRWAYIQCSTYYGSAIGVTETEADNQLMSLMRALLPGLIDWNRVKNVSPAS